MQPCQLSTPGRFSTSSLTTEALQLDEKHDWALQFVQLTRRQHLRSNDPETKATSTQAVADPVYSAATEYSSLGFSLLHKPALGLCPFTDIVGFAFPIYDADMVAGGSYSCSFGDALGSSGTSINGQC